MSHSKKTNASSARPIGLIDTTPLPGSALGSALRALGWRRLAVEGESPHYAPILSMPESPDPDLVLHALMALVGTLVSGGNIELTPREMAEEDGADDYARELEAERVEAARVAATEENARQWERNWDYDAAAQELSGPVISAQISGDVDPTAQTAVVSFGMTSKLSGPVIRGNIIGDVDPTAPPAVVSFGMTSKLSGSGH